MRIIDEVKELKAAGTKKTAALRALGVCRSTYYRWLKTGMVDTKSSVYRLTDAERKAVIDTKKARPQLSHLKISGYPRWDSIWVSSSSCYRILKALNWVQPRRLREALWKVAHYEPFRPNMIWGEDWTILTIAGLGITC